MKREPEIHRQSINMWINMRILAVDDDPIILELLGHFVDAMTGHSFEAVVAAVETTEADTQVPNFEIARGVFHNLAGTAGCVGLDQIGLAARRCEAEIIAFQDPINQGSKVMLLSEVESFVQIVQNAR
jgi:hypothetical protein